MYQIIDTKRHCAVVSEFPTWRKAFNASRKLEPKPTMGQSAWRYLIQKKKDDFSDVLAVLADNDGACLYWQMPDAKRAFEAVEKKLVLVRGELLVHPKAKEIEENLCYTMSV